MKLLNNLIRLHKWQLNEKRQTLTDLERLRDQLNLQLEKLIAAGSQERAVAAASEDVLFAYGAYAVMALEKRETLSASLAAVEQRISAARDEVMVAFRELKRLELSLEAHQRRQRADADRREQQQLDEIALQGHRRRPAAG